MTPLEELKKILSYNPDTGKFTWLARTARATKVGSEAGSKNNQWGHISISINRKRYYAHRLAWYFVHNEWPKSIDHINRDPSDNRIANLRPTTQTQNNANRRVVRNGLKGAFRSGTGWVARVGESNNSHYLGWYKTEEQAHAAYCKAAVRIHGKFARFE